MPRWNIYANSQPVPRVGDVRENLARTITTAGRWWTHTHRPVSGLLSNEVRLRGISCRSRRPETRPCFRLPGRPAGAGRCSGWPRRRSRRKPLPRLRAGGLPQWSPRRRNPEKTSGQRAVQQVQIGTVVAAALDRVVRPRGRMGGQSAGLGGFHKVAAKLRMMSTQAAGDSGKRAARI